MVIPAARAIHDQIAIVPPRHITRYLLIAKSVAVASIITSPLWLTALFFTSPQDYSFTSSLICVPLLAIVCAVVVVHLTQRDLYLRRLLMAGLVAHMAASSAFLWVGFHIYGGTVDAFHYWTVGVQLSEEFQVIGWSAFHAPYWSTNLINSLCGLAALLVGDALPTLFIAFALASLAGGYIFYRAFRVAFPEGDRWLFGLLVLLSPSLLFWSSFIGKDALIQFFIALTCFGFARLTKRPTPIGALLCAIGLAGTWLIRAHVASMLAMAMTFPYAVSRSRTGVAGKVVRVLLIPVLVGGTYFLVNEVISQATSLLDLKTGNSTGVLQEVNTVTRNSQTGGSAFNEGTSLSVRIVESPFLLVRPFPWETHSVMAAASVVESVGWMLLCWVRRRQILFTLREWREPYTAFLLMYSAIFLITFGAAISNFGILLRQRIMVTPLILMIICARLKPEIREALEPSQIHRAPSSRRPASRPDRATTRA